MGDPPESLQGFGWIRGHPSKNVEPNEDASEGILCLKSLQLSICFLKEICIFKSFDLLVVRIYKLFKMIRRLAKLFVWHCPFQYETNSFRKFASFPTGSF